MNRIKAGGKGPRVEYRCSFCGKGQEQVDRLIAGPGGVYICDECVDLCQEIIGDEVGGPKADLARWQVRLPICAQCEKPIEDTRRWGVYYHDVERGIDGLRFVSQFHEACLQLLLQPEPGSNHPGNEP